MASLDSNSKQGKKRQDVSRDLDGVRACRCGARTLEMVPLRILVRFRRLLRSPLRNFLQGASFLGFAFQGGGR